LARISKSSGDDAQFLDEQAHLVEEWLASQNELTKSALESSEAISGLQAKRP